MPPLSEEFTPLYHRVGATNLALVRAGAGPAVLLLHGYPETRAAWHRVAPRLARRFTVVAPDLPGYGDSVGPAPDNHHEHYSKRTSARTLVAAMQALGYERFAVVGHDRGARVAYRMALDHPERVLRLVVLDSIPTLEMAERLTYELAGRMANWFFLAQPAPLPEMVIGAAPDVYLNQILDHWLGTPGGIAPEARAEYARCFRNPHVIRAACADYRAGRSVDLAHDRADWAAGRRIACPVLVLWAAQGLTADFGDPLSIWRKWADDVTGQALPCGHFMMEEAPEEVSALLTSFLTL